LPNLALDTLDEVIEKIWDGLKQCESDPERLLSMTYSPHFWLAGENAGWYEKQSQISHCTSLMPASRCTGYFVYPFSNRTVNSYMSNALTSYPMERWIGKESESTIGTKFWFG